MLANSMPTDCGLSWTVMGEFSVESLFEEPLPGRSLLGGLLFWGLLLGGSLLWRQLFGRLLLGESLPGWSLVLWHVLTFRIEPMRNDTDKPHRSKLRVKKKWSQVHAMQTNPKYVGQNRVSLPFFFPLVLLAPFPFGGTFSFCVDPTMWIKQKFCCNLTVYRQLNNAVRRLQYTLLTFFFGCIFFPPSGCTLSVMIQWDKQ